LFLQGVKGRPTGSDCSSEKWQTAALAGDDAFPPIVCYVCFFFFFFFEFLIEMSIGAYILSSALFDWEDELICVVPNRVSAPGTADTVPLHCASTVTVLSLYCTILYSAFINKPSYHSQHTDETRGVHESIM
jgi:hypothetical protein